MSSEAGIIAIKIGVKKYYWLVEQSGLEIFSLSFETQASFYIICNNIWFTSRRKKINFYKMMGSLALTVYEYCIHWLSEKFF